MRQRWVAGELVVGCQSVSFTVALCAISASSFGCATMSVVLGRQSASRPIRSPKSHNCLRSIRIQNECCDCVDATVISAPVFGATGSRCVRVALDQSYESVTCLKEYWARQNAENQLAFELNAVQSHLHQTRTSPRLQ